MAPVPPVRIADGVFRIPTLGKSAVNSFAFVDDDGTVALVDAGLRGASKRLTTALSELGKRPADVSRILLTHAHGDHAGGARDLRRRTGAPVHVHDADADAVRAGRPAPAGTATPLARVLALVTPGWPPCPVDEVLAEGDLVPVAGGLRVLHTPGHTAGHCSFLHERSGALVTGDALFNLRDKVAYSYAAVCADFPLSRQTAERLGEVDYEVAAFTHGPEIREGAREAVRGFLAERAGR